MRQIILFACFFSSTFSVLAQATSLQGAIDRALEASFEIEQGELRLRQSTVGLDQAKGAGYPRANFSANAGYQFGLNVDPTTNNLVQQRIGFNSYRLDGSWTLYNSGRINKTIAREETNVALSQAQLEDLKQDISLSVANTYLTAMLAKEGIALAQARVKEAETSLERMQKQVSAGSAAPVALAEPERLVALQQQSLVIAQNDLEAAKLRLRQAFRMDPSEPLQLDLPESIDFDAVTLPEIQLNELYSAAISRQPAIEAAKLGEQVALADIEIAKTGRYPTLSLFGGMDTRFSSQAMRFNTSTLMPENIPYGQQLEEFFGQSVGLTLQVPILNNGLTISQIERAKVSHQISVAQSQQARQQLEVEVQSAWQAAVAAKAEVAAAKRALDAAQTTYQAAVKNNEFGAGSQIDVTNAQILLEQAQVTHLQAKYRYLFNVKVVDFYLGRPLTLN